MATEYKKYIPTLRFPEFQNDGEWKTDTMETIFDIKNGYTPSKSNSSFWDNGTIPWFRMEDIRKNGHILSDSIQHVTPAAVKNAGLFPAYSIIVATTATIGEHALIIVDSLANQQFTFLTKRKSFDNKLDMMYFHYFMFIVDEWCKRNTNAGGLLSVNMDSFKKLTIPYPSSLSEQKKIADCFVSIDKEIDAPKRKLELLKEHKKGLMQRLFPAKGKTTPEIRFPEFQNDGEWVEVPFGSIINVNSGKDYKHLDIGNIPVYGTGGYMLSVNDKLSDIDAVGIGRKGTIDKPQYLKAPFWTVDTLFFLTSSKNYDIRYIYYLCQTIPWKTYGEQTGVPSISKNSIDKLDVVITTNLTEQQKIAQSLLHLDNAMDAIEKKIHLLETHKYGLMQNLFPNLNNY